MHSSRMRTARSSSRLPGGCLPQCMLGYPSGCGPGNPPGCGPGDPPQVWAWRHTPPGFGPGDPPQARPLNFPLGCGPGDTPPGFGPGDPPRCGPGDPPPGQTPQLSPWVWAWKHTPWIWAWRPPPPAGWPRHRENREFGSYFFQTGKTQGDPPQARPLNFPLGCGPGNTHPWIWAWRPPPQQGGHGTGKTGNLVLTFSRQGKHREFCSDTGKNLLTRKIFGL